MANPMEHWIEMRRIWRCDGSSGKSLSSCFLNSLEDKYRY